MDQAAEDVVTSYPRRRQVGARGHRAMVAVRWPQVPGPMRAMLVVVRDVLVQDRSQVPRPSDQNPVGDPGPDCAHPAGFQNSATGPDEGFMRLARIR
jgi:hypothetical protein